MVKLDATQITKIVQEEVTKYLAQHPLPASEPILKSGRQNILVIFTGADVGLTTAVEQLHRLRQNPYSFTFLLSRAAQKIIGLDKIALVTSGSPVLTDLPGEQVLSLIQNQDILIVPTLSRTTAIKLASAITDTLVTDLLYTALVNKKPIVAARNAADPILADCPRCGTASMSSALIQSIHAELDKLVRYGIRLVPVEELAAETESVLHSIPRAVSEKQIVTEWDVKSIAASGSKKLRMYRDSLITPLARDAAKELGIEIEII